MMCMLLLFGSSSSLKLETGFPLTLGLDLDIILLLVCGMDDPSSNILVIDKAMDWILDGVKADDTKAGCKARY